jgi:phage gp29-like protein
MTTLKARFSALLRPKPTVADLTTRVATPTPRHDTESPSGEGRKTIDALISGELTPRGVLMQLALARAGDTLAFVRLVEDLLQRDINYATARETVNDTIAAAMLVADAAGPLAKDKRIAAEVQAMLDGKALQAIVAHLCGFEDFGFAVAEIVWSKGQRWTVSEVAPLPPAWFTFDKEDARTIRLLPAEAGGIAQPLLARKYICAVRNGYGLPFLRSHGYVGAFFQAMKSMTLKDWAGFLEMCGQPLRVGYYDPSKIADVADLKVVQDTLRKALRNIGADAWAMLPEGSRIEFVESVTKGASAAAFEDLIRYLDEQMTKRITGSVLATGTGNTGSGGSQALGSVHDDKFYLKVKSTAKVVADAIRECVVEPYIRMNYGPDVGVPAVRFVFDEPDNIPALAAALEKLVPLGLEVAQDEVRDKLGLRAPADGEKQLAPARPTQAAEPALAA